MRIFEPIISGSANSNSNITAISFTGSLSGSVHLPSGQLLIGGSGDTSIPRTLSGDVTVDSSGVSTIGSQKVLTTMLDSSIVNNTTAHNSTPLDLSNTKFFVSSGSTGLNRGLEYSTFLNDIRPRLSTGSFTGSFTGSVRQPLPSANIFVGNSNSIATPVAMTGDVVIDSNGATSLNGRVVTETELHNDIISTFTAATFLTGDSLFAIGGDTTNRKYTYNQLTGSLSASFASAGLFGGSGELPSLTDGKIWIGNGSNVATEVTPSNDINITNTGTVVLNSPAITGKTEVTSVNDTDMFLLYNGTGLRKISKSNLIPTQNTGSSYVYEYTNTVFLPVTHSLNTQYPVVQVYNEVSELFIPQNIKISGSNHIEVRLSNTGSGYVVIQKGGGIINEILDASVYSSYAFPFSGQSSITVNHGLDTAYPIVQVYNTAGYMIVPQDVHVINSGSIEVTFPINTLSGSISVAKGGHIISGSLQNAVSSSYAEYVQSPAVRTHTIPFGISSPLVISAGEKGLKTIGREGKIIGWRLISDVSTTATLDVWKTNSAIPTNGNSICASAKPSLTAGTFNSSTTLTGWTDTFTSNDVFRVEVESNSNSSYLLLELDFLVDNN